MGRAATIRRDWKIIDFQLKSFRRCLFAVASFMLALLALIGLKKSRSFQKPNRIARNFDAFGEYKTRRRGAGPGVARSVAELREFGDGSGAGLGAQRRISGP